MDSPQTPSPPTHLRMVGAVNNDTSTGGFWSDDEKSQNYLELLAVFMGLRTFCKTNYNMHLRILTDNTTAIAVINHMGSSHSDPRKSLGKEIWEWCKDCKICLLKQFALLEIQLVEKQFLNYMYKYQGDAEGSSNYVGTDTKIFLP